MTFNETRLKVGIADLIIFEGLFFNQAQKPRFKKVLFLEEKVSKYYQPQSRKIIPKDLLYVIHYQNIERNFSLIEKSLIF